MTDPPRETTPFTAEHILQQQFKDPHLCLFHVQLFVLFWRQVVFKQGGGPVYLMNIQVHNKHPLHCSLV